MAELAGLCILLLVLGSIFGWVSLVKIRGLQDRVSRLSEQLSALELRGSVNARNIEEPIDSSVAVATNVAADPTKSAEQDEESLRRQSASFWNTAQKRSADNTTVDSPSAEHAQDTLSKSSSRRFDAFLSHLQQHWMIWLGGICVGLAGVFMVRYSIETGLLGPTTRIVLAVLTGLVLHVAADWLRRKAGAQPAFAALAGGASITLYAALLAATHLYQLLEPGTTFVLLAGVSVLTMMLAIQHGPVLAILGILGAYTVPILVNTGSGNIAAALVYSVIITASALWLMTRVYRSWLWLGTLAGFLAWWFISLTTGGADGLRGLYLAVGAYGCLAIPLFDWALQKTVDKPANWRDILNVQNWLTSNQLNQAPIAVGLLFIIGAFAASIVVEGTKSIGGLQTQLLSWLPLSIILLIAARKSATLVALPWLAMLTQMVAWVFVAIQQGEGGQPNWPIRFNQSDQWVFCQYSLVMAVTHSLFAFWHLRRAPNSAQWAALMLLSPLMWLAMSYALTDALALTWQWSVVAIIIGIAYLATARHRFSVRTEGGGNDQLTIWLVLSGHFAYSLAAIILLKEATLTLAIAAQAVSIAWVIRRFNAAELGWLLKLVLAAVVIRLTFNPWLLSYSTGHHWSLYTYGGSTVLCAMAAWLLVKHKKLRAWLEAVTLHLLVLTLWAEARYWLYDGEIFSQTYSFIEAAINANAWAGLALVYYWRSRVSSHLKALYRLLGNTLIFLAAVNYCLLISRLNPLWEGVFSVESATPRTISSIPFFNEMLLAYGLPVVLGVLAFLRPNAPLRFKQLAAVFTGVSAFIFLNLQVRHLWHGQLNIFDPMKSGELYTYSAVWLFAAAAILLIGNARQNKVIYRVGIGLLAAVISKLFLVDMSGLEGMLRVASFMGLGLSLLGLGYLLQQTSGRHVANKEIQLL